MSQARDASPGSSRVVRLEPTGPISGVVEGPPSKSVTNRLLVLGALADGQSRLARPLLSDDTEVMAGGLRTLGVPVELAADAAVVDGRGGSIGPPAGVVWAGLSGTTLRFLAAVSLLSVSGVTLDGDGPLRRRPLGGLVDALVAAGAEVRADRGHAPVDVSGGGLGGGRLEVDAAASSQFATALMLVAPYARRDVELVVSNLGAGGYLDLTVEAMVRWGAVVEEMTSGERDGSGGQRSWRIAAGVGYGARDEAVEYDASAAAHLLALAVASGGSVTVRNACATRQPDAAITALFAEMGASVLQSDSGSVTVTGPASVGELRPITADLREMPDQVVTLAALASLASGTSRFTGLGVVRGHETDRLADVAAELTKIGVEVTEGPDWLEITGGVPLAGTRLATHSDHRMAMGLSLLGTVVPGIEIEDPDCVAKTYPRWWDDLGRLGGGVLFT